MLADLRAAAVLVVQVELDGAAAAGLARHDGLYAAASSTCARCWMLGAMLGCTQPSSSSLCAWLCRGQTPAGVWVNIAQNPQATGTARLALHSEPESGEGSPRWSNQPSARPRSPRRCTFPSTIRQPMSTRLLCIAMPLGMAVVSQLRQVAAVQMRLGLARGLHPLEHLLDRGCAADCPSSRPAAGRWGRWRCNRRSARICAGWPRPPAFRRPGAGVRAG